MMDKKLESEYVRLGILLPPEHFNKFCKSKSKKDLKEFDKSLKEFKIDVENKGK